MFIVTAVGIVGVIYALSSRRPSNAMTPTTSAPSVAVSVVTKGDLPLEVQALGTVTPLSTVTVKSRISGYLTAVAFKEGQMVRKGELLAQIDPRPYEAALAQVQGQLIKDQALLRNAQLDLTRHERLLAQDSTSRQNFDTGTTTVRQLEGTVISDQAQVDAQRLDLAYCHLVAPIDGRAGLRQVDPGNYVQATDPTGLVVITQIQPISVIFTIAQVQLGPVLKRLRADAALPVVAYDGNDTTVLGEGVLDTLDNQIDPSTGTVKLRAVFANRDGELFPNQFVNTRLLVDTRQDVLLVPTGAIRYGMPGPYVYRVRGDDTVAIQVVAVDASHDGRTVVREGLSSGDRVVVDGIDRLSDGIRVAIRPSTLEAADKP
ncbi:MAG: multidrug transporter subunit MdtA [Gammaproteobacteria bacterium]|nr:multidrug transporter subunit MdtA [Gammaproteobacteria bacterium]